MICHWIEHQMVKCGAGAYFSHWSGHSMPRHTVFDLRLPIWGFGDHCKIVHCSWRHLTAIQWFTYRLRWITIDIFANFQPFGWNFKYGISRPLVCRARERSNSGICPIEHSWVPISSILTLMCMTVAIRAAWRWDPRTTNRANCWKSRSEYSADKSIRVDCVLLGYFFRLI